MNQIIKSNIKNNFAGFRYDNFRIHPKKLDGQSWSLNRNFMKTYRHTLELSVRDYECDLQGIVNNAVYLNYLEHARHELLREVNIDFVKLHESGIDPVLIKAEIEYKTSLRSPEKFIVCTNVINEGNVRAVFEQDIYHMPSKKPVLYAVMTTLCIKNGRPIRLPGDFSKIFF